MTRLEVSIDFGWILFTFQANYRSSRYFNVLPRQYHVSCFGSVGWLHDIGNIIIINDHVLSHIIGSWITFILDFRGSHSFCSLFDLVIRGCSFQGEQRSIFYLSTLPLWQQTAAKHNFNISATFILYTVYSLIFLFISCFLPTFLVSPTGRSAIHVRR